MKFAIINKENIVVNVIIWPDGNFARPRNHRVIESTDADIGDIYDPVENVFKKP